MNLDLKDRVIWILGGTRGIGRAVTLALARESCKTAVCARTAAEVDGFGEELRREGLQTLVSVADVTKPKDLRAFAELSISTFGHRLHGLVYCVGGSSGGSFADSSATDWRQTFEVNLFAAIDALYTAYEYLRAAQSPSVVWLASVSGTKPVSRRAQYGAAKASLIYAAQALGRELAHDGIRLNTLSPGSTYFADGRWARFAEESPSEYSAFISSQLPFGRLATPEEIASAVVYLLSPSSNWIAGANISVDGAQNAPNAF